MLSAFKGNFAGELPQLPRNARDTRYRCRTYELYKVFGAGRARGGEAEPSELIFRESGEELS